MSRMGLALIGFLALAVVAMSAMDTTSSDTHNVWHVYAAKTPLAP